jgi:hypothetical protein
MEAPRSGSGLTPISAGLHCLSWVGSGPSDRGCDRENAALQRTTAYGQKRKAAEGDQAHPSAHGVGCFSRLGFVGSVVVFLVGDKKYLSISPINKETENDITYKCWDQPLAISVVQKNGKRQREDQDDNKSSLSIFCIGIYLKTCSTVGAHSETSK